MKTRTVLSERVKRSEKIRQIVHEIFKTIDRGKTLHTNTLIKMIFEKNKVYKLTSNRLGNILRSSDRLKTDGNGNWEEI
jgi:hypothetical protein